MFTDREEYIERIHSPHMAYYRRLYRKSVRWDGKRKLNGKTVIIYCEQGFGDIIQFSRYFHYIKEKNCELILHCPKELHKLFRKQCDKIITKNINKLPDHDYHILSMSLPFVLNKIDDEEDVPYIKVKQKKDLKEHKNKFKIGIAWEGNPNHSNNLERSCPLEYFKQLSTIPNTSVFMLQNKIYNEEFLKNCEEMSLYGHQIDNFWDTATLINSLDLIISVDTAVLHLAGAMGKRTYGLISHYHDPRWIFKKWYPTTKFIKQTKSGDWNSVFDQLFKDLNLVYEPIDNNVSYSSILFTGGVGDVIALESYIPAEHKKQIKRIYCASRSFGLIKEIFEKLEGYPKLEKVISLWDDFSNIFAFYSKSDCERTFDKLPYDWNNTVDWSILHKFEEINAGYYTYGASSILNTKMCELSMALPSRFVTIVPSSYNHPKMIDRNFDKNDWNLVMRFLDEKKISGVVLSTDSIDVPKHRRIIDLSKTTNILQSIEILKKSKGYLGIDSCLSVLAAKLFSRNIYIKSKNEHLDAWKHIYYAPRRDFKFINNLVT